MWTTSIQQFLLAILLLVTLSNPTTARYHKHKVLDCTTSAAGNFPSPVNEPGSQQTSMTRRSRTRSDQPSISTPLPNPEATFPPFTNAPVIVIPSGTGVAFPTNTSVPIFTLPSNGTSITPSTTNADPTAAFPLFTDAPVISIPASLLPTGSQPIASPPSGPVNSTASSALPIVTSPSSVGSPGDSPVVDGTESGEGVDCDEKKA